MKSKSQTIRILFIALSVFQTLWATDAEWTGATDNDLNTASNWVGSVVPTGIAIFDSNYPNVEYSPEATTLFTIDNIHFLDSASFFGFSFTSPGALQFTGIGLSGTHTDTFFQFSNSITMNTAQLFFAPTVSIPGASLGDASFRFFNNTTGVIDLNNAAQLSLGDNDAGLVAPITAGDNLNYFFENTHIINSSTNEAAQVFMKGSTFTVGDHFNFTAQNGYYQSVGGTISGRSDTGQVVFDAGDQTASWTVGDDANFFLTNGDLFSTGSSISSSHNNAGQIIFDGKGGTAAFTVGKNAQFTIINQYSSTISNQSSGNDAGQMVFDGNDGIASFTAGDNANINMSLLNNSSIQGLGFDTGQIVIDGDGGTASFTLGNSSSLTLTSCSNASNTLLSGSDGNDAGQIVIDGNNGTASFSAGSSAKIYLSNAGGSSIISQHATAGHDAGQIVIDGNNNSSAIGAASFSLGDNSTLALFNASGSTISSAFNTGQFVVDGNLGSASVTLGNNDAITLGNNGVITNVLAGSIAAQAAFNGSTAQSGSISLNTGTNSSITATLGSNGTITNAGIAPAAQIYFNSTAITGNPTLSAINLSATAVEGIVFDGTSTAGFSDIILQNSSLLVNTTGHPLFTIGSLSGDAASVVKLNQNLEIHTPNGKETSFAGVILDQSGSNNLIISGGGTQILSGANTFGGNTSIFGGILLLNGPVLHDAAVYSGATLAGTGTVNGSVAINPNATIIPGLNPGIGTFHISQNYTQAAGGLFQALISGATTPSGIPLSSLLDIGGTASLAGTLKVQSADGTYSIGRPYTVLTAGALNGTFNQVSALTPFLNVAAIYNQDPSVQLILSTNFLPGARTSNQRSVAEQIDENTLPTDNQQTVINNLLALCPSSLPKALDEMAGEQYSYLAQINQHADQRFGRRIFDAVRNYLDPCYCDPCCGTNTWLTFEYQYGKLENCKISRGYKESSEDISLGMENNCGCFLYGTALNLESNHLSFNLRGANTLYNVQGALYGAYQNRRCRYYIFSDLIVGEGYSDFDRPIHFADLRKKAKSKPKFTHGQLYAETGLNYCWCDILLQPFVGGDCNYVKANRFHECHAKSLNLTVKGRSIWSENIYLGTHLSSSLGSLPCLGCIAFNADFIYQHRFGSLGTTLHNRFREFGETFEVKGAEYSRNGVIANVNAAVNVMQLVDCYVEFSTEYWDHRHIWAGSVGLNYCW